MIQPQASALLPVNPFLSTDSLRLDNSAIAPTKSQIRKQRSSRSVLQKMLASEAKAKATDSRFALQKFLTNL